MAIALRRGVALVASFSYVASALQVTSGSPCADICKDDPQSGTSSSNTFVTDIVCRDVDYTEREAGRKFRACQTCLQSSDASAAGESDQFWFIYNLRFAAATCIFDYTNQSSNTCATSSTCGPIRKSLEDGGLTAESATWNYCLANNNAFLGSYLEDCTMCLRSTSDQKYLGNFMVGLKAGCIQRPSPQVLIGVDGDIFSSVMANVSNHGIKPNSSTGGERKSLSQGATIGIAVGTGVAVVALGLIFFFCFRRRWQTLNKRLNMEKLASPLDSRFGSSTITSPNNGAYANPYATPRIDVNETTTATLHSKSGSINLDQPPKSILKGTFSRSRSSIKAPHITTTHHVLGDRRTSDSTFPIHQAYIPSPVSATSTLGSLPFSPANDHKVSPDFNGTFVPLRRMSQSSKPVSRSSSTTSAHKRLVEESIRCYTPGAQATTTPESSPPLQSQFRPQPRARSRSRSTSRPRSRAPSRSDIAMSAYRDRSTVLAGVGNSNASHDGPTNRLSSGAGPALNTHFGRRLDFEAAERERAQRKKKGEIVTPVSGGNIKQSPADSEMSAEMWPGKY